MYKKQLFGLSLCIVLLAGMLSGCISPDEPKDTDATIIIPGIDAIESSDLHGYFSSFYEIDSVSIDAQASPYSLPLAFNAVSNHGDIQTLFALSSTQKDALEQNGFVVIPHGNRDTMEDAYEFLKERNVPVFISSDSLLHVYHIFFDTLLKNIETRILYDDILTLTEELLEQAKHKYENSTDEDVIEAARRNVAFFSVGLALLHNITTDVSSLGIPSYVTDEVEGELDLIEAHQGFANSPLFVYREDYSQYVPRGHYTDTDLLKQYFKAMMWYGRMSFLLKGGDPACPSCAFLISSEDSMIQTIQGFLISQDLQETTSLGEILDSIWKRMYTVTSFFVGTADDLTPYMYRDALNDVFGSTTVDDEELSDTANLIELKGHLAVNPLPQIYGGTGEIIIAKPPGVPFTLEDLNETLDKTMGMRLMGQRFILDSYMFQQLVFPAVDLYMGSLGTTPFTLEYTAGGPTRAFPRGLDIMAAFGSDLALTILEEDGDTSYSTYMSQLGKLRENISEFTIANWTRNLYTSWLYTITGLLEPTEEGYPLFMRTDAWAKKSLATALASWTELRHDTILYAKQSYTPIKFTSIEPPQPSYHGFVEPVPHVYTRLLAMIQMTREGLDSLSVITEDERDQLQEFEQVIDMLITLTVKELEGMMLTDEEYEYIATFDETLRMILSDMEDTEVKTTMIADVHTDTNSQQVLEEAVGLIHTAIVAYADGDDTVRYAAGPVLSYYEFKHPMNDRLTDEQWIEMIEQGTHPDPPSWMDAFLIS